MNFKVGCILKQPSNFRNETEVNKEFTGYVKLRAVPPFPSFSAKSVARVKKISEKKKGKNKLMLAHRSELQRQRWTALSTRLSQITSLLSATKFALKYG